MALVCWVSSARVVDADGAVRVQAGGGAGHRGALVGAELLAGVEDDVHGGLARLAEDAAGVLVGLLEGGDDAALVLGALAEVAVVVEVLHDEAAVGAGAHAVLAHAGLVGEAGGRVSPVVFGRWRASSCRRRGSVSAVEAPLDGSRPARGPGLSSAERLRAFWSSFLRLGGLGRAGRHLAERGGGAGAVLVRRAAACPAPARRRPPWDSRSGPCAGPPRRRRADRWRAPRGPGSAGLRRTPRRPRRARPASTPSPRHLPTSASQPLSSGPATVLRSAAE